MYWTINPIEDWDRRIPLFQDEEDMEENEEEESNDDGDDDLYGVEEGDWFIREADLESGSEAD